MSTKTLLSLITLERKVQTLHKKYIFVVRMRQAGSSQGFTTELGSDDSSSRWKGKIMAISHSEHLTSGPSVKRQMSGNSKCHLIPDRAQNTGTSVNPCWRARTQRKNAIGRDTQAVFPLVLSRPPLACLTPWILPLHKWSFCHVHLPHEFMDPFLSGVSAHHTATFQCEDNGWDVAASVQLLFSVADHSVPNGQFNFSDILQTAVLIRALC